MAIAAAAAAAVKNKKNKSDLPKYARVEYICCFLLAIFILCAQGTPLTIDCWASLLE
jgi:hypothetical protein